MIGYSLNMRGRTAVLPVATQADPIDGVCPNFEILLYSG